jgi:hypothetical protein
VAKKRSVGTVEKPKSIQDFVDRYPRVLTRIKEAGNLNTISQAAVILRDAVEGRRSWSDWVLSMFQGDPLKAVRHSAIHRRAKAAGAAGH